MAHLIASGGWTAPGTVAAYLRETLPDDYVVIADPVIARVPVTCLVAGRTALFVVHPVEEGVDGESEAPAVGADPAVARNRAAAALRLFLNDEFPTVCAPVRHVEALRDWAADLPTWRVVATPEQPDDLLSEAIQAQDVEPGVTLSPDIRVAIAEAVRDRQFTASQRAERPFVFRSGGALRAGRPMWTLRDVVTHMDRYPAEGIHHLRNGTLAEWLDEEGAAHLAKLARSVITHPGIDMRVALEEFLIGTGLVQRPALHTHPQRLDLGYAVEGHPVSSALQLSAGKSRGYLYGSISTSDPWLQVTPTTFIGPHFEVVVSADTNGLRIRPNPIKAQIIVKCSASEEPIVVPVILRVMALPSPISRSVFRPLVGVVSAAPIGLLLGWLLMQTNFRFPLLNAPAWPVVTLGGLWALAGLWRGIRQPAAWPVVFALRRWVEGAAMWSALLGIMTGLLVWSWTHGVGAGMGVAGSSALQAALAAAAAGCVPAILYELAHSRVAANPRYVMGRHSPKRIAALSTALAAVLMMALLAPRMLSPLLRHIQVGPLAASAESSVNAGLGALDSAIDKTIDGAMLKIYDHGAPKETGSARDAGGPTLKLPRLPFVGR